MTSRLQFELDCTMTVARSGLYLSLLLVFADAFLSYYDLHGDAVASMGRAWCTFVRPRSYLCMNA